MRVAGAALAALGRQHTLFGPVTVGPLSVPALARAAVARGLALVLPRRPAAGRRAEGNGLLEPGTEMMTEPYAMEPLTDQVR